LNKRSPVLRSNPNGMTNRPRSGRACAVPGESARVASEPRDNTVTKLTERNALTSCFMIPPRENGDTKRSALHYDLQLRWTIQNLLRRPQELYSTWTESQAPFGRCGRQGSEALVKGFLVSYTPTSL